MAQFFYIQKNCVKRFNKSNVQNIAQKIKFFEHKIFLPKNQHRQTRQHQHNKRNDQRATKNPCQTFFLLFHVLFHF